MSSMSFLILYVRNVGESVRFYETLLGCKPANQSAGFAIFRLDNGLQLGLWLTAAVEPESMVTGGGAEYCIDIDSARALGESFSRVQAAGFVIAQRPTEMPFGLTFVVEDPDSHRIRYYVPPPR